MLSNFQKWAVFFIGLLGVLLSAWLALSVRAGGLVEGFDTLLLLLLLIPLTWQGWAPYLFGVYLLWEAWLLFKKGPKVS